MQFPPDLEPRVGYVVSTWPRLSQTFVLNEILALERAGLSLRIFSTKAPRAEPVSAKVAEVRAPVAYLNFQGHRGAILLANLRIARDLPGRYLRTLIRAMRYGRRSILRRFFQAGYLADTVRRQAVTHLHAHFTTAPTQVAMFTHELIGVPYTFTAHARDIYADTHPKLLRAEMECAQAVVTVSHYNRDYLLQIKPDLNGKLRCIECGLDLSEFNFRWPRASDPPPPTVLAVARLVEKKGLGDLILAAAVLRRQGHSFRVEIIGDGELRHVLKCHVEELGLQDCIVLLGAQPHEKVRAAYDRASIFALPCVIARDGDRDGLPIALLEAMASGLPVVSTPVVGIPELIDSGRNGLLTPPSDPAALANTLAKLLGNASLRDQLALAARATIEARFAIDHSARKLLELFYPYSEMTCCR
ncbi:MAG TPA: glycosyltransferase family 4 protein [Terriglobales bacterium]|nr:glycosyltransferase family 4 protein [Terriglobales bacterium]